MYGSAGSGRIDVDTSIVYRGSTKISLAPLQSSAKRQVVVDENGAGYFGVRFEGWKKGKSPIEWGRRKIGEARDRDEGSIKSPVFSPRHRESQMTVGTQGQYQHLQSGVLGSGCYVFGKVRDFVL